MPADSLRGTFLEKKLYAARKSEVFFNNYVSVSDAFVQTVFPQVTALGNANSKDVFLTDHGVDHVRTVVKRASSLVEEASIDLNLYEAFLLLIAIHMHDVGNALGRIGHEGKIDEIWGKVFGPLGFDELDKTIAVSIARVHGGSVAGSKDTIRSIERSTEWKNATVRPRLLAAILRLADEIAEDRSRASSLGLELDNIPDASKLYHVFSRALHTFAADVKDGELRMHFAAEAYYFTTPYQKAGGQGFLLEEIFERSLKAYHEARYCSRYTEGWLMIDKVRVRIEIYKGSAKLKSIVFLLEEQDHPSVSPTHTVYQLAPELADFEGSGSNLTSTLLRAELEQVTA